jgi:hypothetical protein
VKAKPTTDRVINPVKVTATVQNMDTGVSFYEFEYIDKDGKAQTRLVEAATCQNESQVVTDLVRCHAALPDNREAARKFVRQALNNKSDRAFKITSRTGWTKDGSFVYPGRTFGLQAETLIHRCGENGPLGVQSGTIEGWTEGLWEPCRYSDYLILAASISFAAHYSALETQSGVPRSFTCTVRPRKATTRTTLNSETTAHRERR